MNGFNDELLSNALIDDIIGGDLVGQTDDDLETQHIPNPKAIKRDAKLKLRKLEREQSLKEILPDLPKQNESIHIISGAKFDFWTWCPVICQMMSGTDDLWCSTWTASRSNCVELIELADNKIIRGKIHMLTGLYFKRRESAVYSFLLNEIQKRDGEFKASRNHAKVVLLKNTKANQFLTIEGSANLTSNPRLEQYIVSNDKKLYDFHKNWMKELIAS